ncbi:MAG: hypothetical protein JSR21_08040 [Proteobacteria bacterium]|nr:hypothetical protein [Pseudomonadota bacterium]
MNDAQSVIDLPLSQEAGAVFELGGPAYRLMQRVGLIKGTGPSVLRRSAGFIAITWFPLLVFSVLEGHALEPTPRMAFLRDYTTYARFFLAVPLVFAAEAIVGPRIRAAGLRFIEAGIVRPESSSAFSAAVARVQRRREAYLPEAAFLIIAVLGAWFVSLERVAGLESATWHTVWADGQLQSSLAGFWYNFVATPLVQFFALRWLWRLVIWTLFLWDVSRMRLNILATHTDMAGGLGFLGVAQASIAIFPFAVGCILSAELAFRARFEGLNIVALQSMMPLLIAYLVFVEFITFGPLLIFLPLLARARLDALRSYGMLVQRHNQLFHDKWIAGDRASAEVPLGNPDMSSLVDLGSSFTVVRQMNIVPVGATQLIQVAIVSCLPALPLIFLVLPFAEVLKLVIGVIR